MTDVAFEHVAAGVSGHVAGYDVFVRGGTVAIVEDVVDPDTIVTRKIDGIGEFVEDAGELRLGWGEFPDFEVIYLYDRADGGFGYAVNLGSPRLSEWGYAPIEFIAND